MRMIQPYYSRITLGVLRGGGNRGNLTWFPTPIQMVLARQTSVWSTTCSLRRTTPVRYNATYDRRTPPPQICIREQVRPFTLLFIYYSYNRLPKLLLYILLFIHFVILFKLITYWSIHSFCLSHHSNKPTWHNHHHDTVRQVINHYAGPMPCQTTPDAKF